jgi:plastocyanin
VFNSAAKLQYGLAAVALVIGVVYGLFIDDKFIFVLALGLFAALLLGGLALTGAGIRDRAPRYLSADDAPPLEMVSLDRSLLSGPSLSPLVAAVAIGVFALGLAVGAEVVWVGLIAGLLAAGVWLAQSWREDSTYTPREGERVSQRLLAPVGLPVMTVVLVGVIVISVSRILLAVPKDASVAIAFGLAAVLLVAFFILASRPKVGRATLVFLSGFAVVAVATAGGVSAGSGYRTFENHESGPPPLNETAQNTSYQVKDFTVTQGQAVRITFANLDNGTYHNMAVYTENPGGTPIWAGEPVRGVKKITYTTLFNQAGHFAFRCDFHPTMTGTFTVVNP